jgi:cell division protein FtsI (penicillin-binding protein 3)
VVQKSSNVGTVKLAMQLAPRDMWDLFSRVGLGRKPELDFPGLATGRLRPHASWRPIEQATMSYGYGLSVSLLQLARAYTVFARDGELIPLSLVHAAAAPSTVGAAAAPVPGVPILPPEIARTVRGMLQLAAGPGGTAPKAQTVGYSVGGKTGTARKQEGKGYSSDKYRAWFVGLAPVSKPRIVVAVMIDEPRNRIFYGGDVAAPVFSQVVQHTLRSLGVPPDIEFRPDIVNDGVPAVEESF